MTLRVKNATNSMKKHQAMKTVLPKRSRETYCVMKCGACNAAAFLNVATDETAAALATGAIAFGFGSHRLLNVKRVGTWL